MIPSVFDLKEKWISTLTDEQLTRTVETGVEESTRADSDTGELAYAGPVLRRRNLKFVRSTGNEADKDSPVMTSKGAAVSGIYASIVGLSVVKPGVTSNERGTEEACNEVVGLAKGTHISATDAADSLDFTPGLYQQSQRPTAQGTGKSARPIHEMLASTKVTPPVHYAIKPSNVGFQMLERQGWGEGESLGLVDDAIKVPLKPVIKHDKGGIGRGTVTKKQRTQPEKSQRMTKHQRKLAYKREQDDRKAMLSYMNRN